MTTESYETPEMLAADPSDRYPIPADDNITIGWDQQQDDPFNGMTSDPAPMPHLKGLPGTGSESYTLDRLDPSLSQNSIPRIEVSPLAEPTAAASQQGAFDPYFGRADSVLTKLQLALAGSNPPAGNAPDIVMKHGFQSHSVVVDSGDGSQDPSVFNFAGLPGHFSTAQLPTDNKDQDMATNSSLNTAGVSIANTRRPERYVACPFNKHDGIVYAACQGYRAKTVNELYVQHIWPYHACRGHIPGPVLARLATLSGSNPSEHWYALYSELFIGEPRINQLRLPSPFWVPTVSTTNLEDLVRAVVDLSGQEVSIPTTRQTTQPANISLAPFHLRVKELHNLINQATNTELAQVRRRWDAVRTEAMTRLATNSQFDPRILYDFSGGPPHRQRRSETTNPRLVRPAPFPGTQAVPHITSPEDLLDLTDLDFGHNMSDSPSSMPIATPSNAFGNRNYDMTKWSRRSTPNDPGYASNLCKWLPEDDDPRLCRLCGKTQDLHDFEFASRQR
ncbi:hypothetical protein DV737_g2861, partial [Chaetothyriales sp. CBS 132003]